MSDAAIRTVVTRLSRPHRSGGVVIERAAILAEGEKSGAILEWIVAHAGEPEAPVSAGVSHGLHGSGVTASRAPARYVLPEGVVAQRR